ncbi:MAG: radical SAM protein [Nanoarchaeota archaeon]|nr:radical SAM protein [Nanoarchaeota archaeon]
MKRIIKINQNSGVPLLGLLHIGIIDRANNNLIQVRPTTICNLDCKFCSTNSKDIKIHPNDFIVEKDYMIKWVKGAIKLKNSSLNIFLDSVGEPFTYPNILNLIQDISKIKDIENITTITNGTLLNKNLIKSLENTKLSQINISLHSLDKEKSKFLMGSKSYNINKLLDTINLIYESNIDLILTPVYLPGINEKDIEDIIKLSKELKCKIGIQKYEKYKYSKKDYNNINYYKFYEYIKKLENKHKIKLNYKSFNIKFKKTNKIPLICKKNEKLNVEVKEHGWFSNEKIAVHKNRAITVLDCKKDKGDNVNIRIFDNKDGIYLAK